MSNEFLGDLLRNYKQNKDQFTRKVLLGFVHQHVLEVAQEKQWGARDISIFEKLADGIIKELCEYTCTLCGDRVYKVQKAIYACRKCNGTKQYKPTKAARARQLGISRVTFGTTWDERWELLYNHLKERMDNK